MTMQQSHPIRVLIVDDHAMVRRGLSAFLQAYDDLELAGEAASGEEALACCAQTQPDVVLMDLMLPEMDGISVIASLREICPHCQVIALTSFNTEELVQRALHAGAIGYLLKNVSAEELAQAIRAASTRQATLAPEAAHTLVHATSHPPATSVILTVRERQVLTLLVRGLNNPEIAEQLGVSRSTVKFHISSILDKLGVDSRTEAVALAVQHHLVS